MIIMMIFVPAMGGVAPFCRRRWRLTTAAPAHRRLQGGGDGRRLPVLRVGDDELIQRVCSGRCAHTRLIASKASRPNQAEALAASGKNQLVPRK